MRLRREHVYRLIASFISFISFIIGVITNSVEIKSISILLIIVFNIILSLIDLKKYVLFLFFNITFFIFIFSRFFLNVFFRYNSTEYGDYGTNFVSTDTINFMINTVFISLFIITLTSSLFFIIFTKEYKNDKKLSKNFVDIKKVSLLFFYITLIFKFLYITDQRNFVSSGSYYEFFLSYESSLPYLFIKIAELNLISFISFLSSSPDKRNFKIHSFTFFVISLYSLTVGRRIEFMLNIILLCIYYSLNYINKNSVRGVKGKIGIVLSTPILIYLLNLISYKRDNMTGEKTGIWSGFQNFLFSQGVSLNILGYTKELGEMLPEKKWYSIGSLIDFIQSNIIFSTIFNTKVYRGQTVERALEGHSFAHAISYSIMPTAYLLGRGYGTSYLAELYIDLGYFGIVIGSFFIGILLVVLPLFFTLDSWIVKILCLLMMRSIVLLPRAEFISFITSPLTLINILGVVLIYICSRFMLKIKIGRRYS